jgi:predicted metalloprotease with PDZ domain
LDVRRTRGAADPRLPLGGVTGGGHRLIYKDTPNQRMKKSELGADLVNLRHSLGLELRRSGSVIDVIAGSPAAKAGVAPTMKIVAVGGRRFTREVLADALKAARSSADPIELLIEHGDFFRTLRVDYHGGERYPHLERDASRPDLIARIIAPRVPPAPAAPSAH